MSINLTHSYDSAGCLPSPTSVLYLPLPIHKYQSKRGEVWRGGHFFICISKERPGGPNDTHQRPIDGFLWFCRVFLGLLFGPGACYFSPLPSPDPRNNVTFCKIEYDLNQKSPRSCQEMHLNAPNDKKFDFQLESNWVQNEKMEHFGVKVAPIIGKSVKIKKTNGFNKESIEINTNQ